MDSKKICETCKYHYISSVTYRDICEKSIYKLIIPDAVVNWIKWFGCASWNRKDE